MNELEDVRQAIDILTGVVISLSNPHRTQPLTPTEKHDLRLALSAVENLTEDIREVVSNA